MPPFLALILWFVLLVALFWWDPGKESGVSAALWVPLIWMFIMGSRLPSQWLGVQVGSQVQAMEEGNPIDRTIFFGLMLAALGILMSRSFKWDTFFARNLALTAFLLFALISVVWSDFPLVALKRWFRDLGVYFAVLVVLSDPRPLDALRTVLRRLAYLLIPLSIVLDKYFPGVSRIFDPWTGIGMYAGATTGKNLLGLDALLAGLFFFWDTVTRWPDRRDPRTKRIIRLNIGFFALSLWVLNTANSATCRVCMVLGCLIVAAAYSKFFRRHPGFLKALIPSTFVLYLLLAYGLNLSGAMAGAVGKDPTLTDRTKIWSFLLGMHTNPLIGTGYESFWMGSRLEWFWERAGVGHLNEAHNGYLEVYLNLGIIGLLLLGGFLIASYKKICRQLTTAPALASVGLAVWSVMLFYDVTEAGFRSGLIWLVFLLVSLSVPGRAEDRVMGVAAIGSARNPIRFQEPRLETAGQRR
ncbi:MAG: O-antigen ligase family protein [Candidatus Acidiferrales bacterium]